MLSLSIMSGKMKSSAVKTEAMKGVAMTHIGIEAFAKKEIKSILGVDADIRTGAVVFPVSDETQLCSLAYRGRLFRSVMRLLADFRIKDIDDIAKNITPDIFSDVIPDGSTFAVRCTRISDKSFSSKEVEQELGALIFENLKVKVNLSSPDVGVMVYIIEDHCYVGIDYAGFDLSKREYRVFSYGDPLKGSVAQALNCIADIRSKDVLLDPFSTSGIIPIEAALFLSGRSVHYYDKEDFTFPRLPSLKGLDTDKFFESQDKMVNDESLNITCSDYTQKNVRCAEKNAKVAGVNKKINFSRLDIEWLDTKFDEGSVDKIVTFPPQVSKRNNEAQVLKVLDEFFYVSKVILSDKGIIVMVFGRPELLSKSLEKHGFMIKEKLDVWQGAECLHILVIKKS